MTHDIARPTRPTWSDHLLARLHGRRLDDLLAGGADPDDDRLLEARAAWLTSTRQRDDLADAWLGTLDQARATEVALDTRIVVARQAVLDAESDIIRLAGALRLSTPADAGLVVRARALLADGKGALYTGQGLEAQVTRLADELDHRA